MMLNEEFTDSLDELNDFLTDLCEAPFETGEHFIRNLELADDHLRTKGLCIDYKDIEEIKDDSDSPTEDEALSFLLPLYDNEQVQTDYNLHVIYFQDISEEVFEMDMEVQYVWEAEGLTDADDDYDE